MNLDEFLAEAARIDLTADVFAAQLAQRPEFADCVSLNINDIANASSVSMNPFALGTADEIQTLLRSMCTPELSASDAAEVEDQIEALVPAAVELRDQGHLDLNARSLSGLARLEGFVSLANDQRLTTITRRRCAAIRDRMIVFGVKSMLGHSGN